MMDSGLSQSKSLPSNLTTGRRHRVSISVSGSYQSHLSSLGHFHRVRTTSEQVSLGPIDSEKDYLHILEGGLTEQRRVGRLGLLKQLATDPAAFLSDDLRRIRGGHVWRLRTLVTLYFCFCVVFLTVKIHAFSREVFQVAHRQPAAEANTTPDDSRLMNISSSQRLSVAFRELAPQAHLETFVVQARPSPPSDLTACLWIEDAHAEDALASAATWPGSVSLVVVTTHAPNTTAAATLRDHLTRRTPSSRTSAHILYVPSVAGGSTTAYLNMARFFARTSRVVLFPEGIPTFELPVAGAGLRPRLRRWLDALPVHASHPVFLSNTTQRDAARAGVPPSLRVPVPVVLPRDHPVWCAERGYVFGSRVLDWEDCVWKLWLESAGEASVVTVPLLWDGAPKNASGLSVSPHVMKLRLRWSAKYRSEACAFALKRSQALESLSRTEKRHTQWRKKFCRETVGLGAPLDVA